MKKIIALLFAILISPLFASAFVNTTYYSHIGLKFNETAPLGVLQTLSSVVPGNTQITLGDFVHTNTSKRVIGNFATTNFYSWLSASVAGRLVVHWELLNNTNVICTTPETAFIGVSIVQYNINCPQLVNPFVISSGNNFTIRLYVRNTAGVATTINYYYDTILRSSRFELPKHQYSAILNKLSYGRGEYSTATMSDNLKSAFYNINWYNKTGGVICTSSGTTPAISEQMFYHSCYMPTNISNQTNAYFIYNSTSESKKIYFNITKFTIGAISFIDTKIKYGGNAYLGEGHGIESKIFVGTDLVSNAICHLEITDENGVPYSSQEAISNGDGTIAFYGIVEPSIYQERSYIYRMACYCLNSSDNACVPNHANVRGETEIAFDVIPWIEKINFTVEKSTIYTEQTQYFNITLKNNWIDVVNINVDTYLDCSDRFVKLLYSALYPLSGTESFRHSVAIRSGVSSHEDCRIKKIVYPKSHFDVPYVFYSDYFDVIDLGNSINISVATKDIHMFDNYPVTITIHNPVMQDVETILDLDFFAGDVEFFNYGGDVKLKANSTNTFLVVVPFYEQNVVTEPDTGWLENSYSNLINRVQQGDLNVTVLAGISFSEDEYYNVFSGFKLKRPYIIYSIYPVGSIGNSTNKSVFDVDYYGNIDYIMRANMTNCFTASGTSKIPINIWISPVGSINVFGKQEPLEVLMTSNCTSKQIVWAENKINLLGGNIGYYNVYFSFKSGVPYLISQIYVNGTIPNATVEERELSVFESISTGIGGIIDKLAELIQVIANALGFKPFELFMSVSAPDYVHVGEYWDVYAVLTDQYDRTLSNYTCLVNTNIWGVLAMNYSNVNQRYEARKFVTTGGTLTWAVTC